MRSAQKTRPPWWLPSPAAWPTISASISPYSLYDQDLVTFEEGKVAYDHRDAGGFIKLNALRLRVLAKRDKR